MVKFYDAAQAKAAVAIVVAHAARGSVAVEVPRVIRTARVDGGTPQGHVAASVAEARPTAIAGSRNK